MNLGYNKPRVISKKTPVLDKRVSVCTDCKRGIFNFHAYTWSRRGLVHIDCKHPIAEDTNEIKVNT